MPRQRHQEVVATTRAPGPREAVGEHATPQVASELVLHEIRNGVAHGIGFLGQGQLALQVLLDDVVEGGGLRALAPKRIWDRHSPAPLEIARAMEGFDMFVSGWGEVGLTNPTGHPAVVVPYDFGGESP